MAKEIRWTSEAENTFETIVNYLEKNWSKKEVSNFVQATFRTIDFISKQPLIFRKVNIKDVHEALITPHNLLIYKISSSHIDLIMFWDTRKNPKKKKSISLK